MGQTRQEYYTNSIEVNDLVGEGGLAAAVDPIELPPASEIFSGADYSLDFAGRPRDIDPDTRTALCQLATDGGPAYEL
jgi:hypothetical protein